MSEETGIGLEEGLALEMPEEVSEPIQETEPVAETEASDLPAEPTEKTEELPEAESPDAESGKRQAELPSQVAKLARELSQQRPEIAQTVKGWRDGFFKSQEYEKTFGNIDEARNLKTTIEALGGEQGLVDLQAAAEDLRALDERVAQGDPQVIDAMISEAPEGFKKLMLAGLERLSQLDPGAYESAIRTPLVHVLSNVGERLAEAGQWLESGQPEFAKRQLNAVLNWIEAQKKQSDGIQPSSPDPRLAEIEQRESKVRESEERAFVSGVGREAIPYIRSKVFESLKPQIAAARLSPEAKDAFFRDVMSEFDKLDSVQLGRWKALVRARDSARATSYVKARADASAERIAQKIWKTRSGSLTTKPTAERSPAATTRTPSSGAGTESNPLRVPKKPEDSQIDRNAPNWQMNLIAGRAKLVTGKYVRWR